MKGLSASTTRDLILSVGTHKPRRRLSPVEVAEALQQTIDAGTELRELAQALHLEGPTMIRRFLRLLDLPSEVRPLVDWGSGSSSLSFTTASHLARLDSTDEQKKLATAVLENQLSKSEVKQVVQIRERSGRAIEESLDAVLRLRPEIEKRFMIIGQLRSQKLKKQLEEMNHTERTALLRVAMQRHGPGLPQFGAKLTTTHFVLVGDEQYHAAITQPARDFEQVITQYLLIELGEGD